MLLDNVRDTLVPETETELTVLAVPLAVTENAETEGVIEARFIL